jgi:Na(+)-translocating NADH:ubiquinone oxidoreductase C subunit
VKDSPYALVFSVVLGSTCALLLTAAARVTAPYRQANALAEKNLNILLVLKVVPLQPEISYEQLVEMHEKVSSKQLAEMYQEIPRKQQFEIYNENVRQVPGDITTYVYSPPQAKGKPLVIALQFSGRGLWGPIKGLLALDPEIKTIRGITFYELKETPGLGGEIVTEKFRNRFVGKKIHDKDGKVGIIICKPGTAKEQNEIDGITSATMTCDKVQGMINMAIKKVLKEKE